MTRGKRTWIPRVLGVAIALAISPVVRAAPGDARPSSIPAPTVASPVATTPSVASSLPPLADTGPLSSARFALIIGVNKSFDAAATPLKYADDDAALYLDLFRSLGARSYLLTRPDDNTRRLHPQAAAEALEPTRAELTRTVEQLAIDLEQARQRHVSTIVYVVYAGHGSASGGRGYISLEDARLGTADLEAMVDRWKADQTHFIVDACYSYFLATGRGPGGQRREVRGFSQVGGLTSRPGVGLLFSTSSARESHEWAGFQAGVFSHEVRSGLYGAADADGDGQVTYREMVAFIQRANASVPNERFRSDVFAHPATDSGLLVDLREGLKRRIEVKGAYNGHYLLEDTRGVRLADFHNGQGQDVRLLRPPSAGQLYLRREPDEKEYVIPSAPDVVELAMLDPRPSATTARGAANDAFNALFELPFRTSDVAMTVLLPPPNADVVADDDGPSGPPVWRRYAGVGLVGAGMATGTAGVLTLLSARRAKDDLGLAASQADVATANDSIRAKNTAAGIELGVAGAATLSGLVLLFWPSSSAFAASQVQTEATAHGASVRFSGTF